MQYHRFSDLRALYPCYYRLWVSVYKLWEGVVQEVLVKKVTENAAGHAKKEGDAIAVRTQIQTINEGVIKRTFVS